MTNAITRITSGAIKLSSLEEAVLSEAASEQNAFDFMPTRIKISPGGINQWVTSDGEAMKTFTGIIVISQKSRVYWPDKGTGAPPLCSSPDGVHGFLGAEPTDAQWQAAATAQQPHPALPLLDSGAALPATFACAACPLSQFGTAHQGGSIGRGTACKGLRRLVVAVDGWAQPALLTLPPTSLRSLDTYASSLAQRRSAYFAVKTKFSLEAQKSGNGDPYSMAVFSMSGPLSEDELTAVIAARRDFEGMVRTLPVDSSDYDTAPPMQTGEPVDADGNPLPF